MGKVILENLDDDVLAMLRANALGSGRSLEDEIKRIVADAVSGPQVDKTALREEMAKTRAMTPPGFNVDMTQLIREDRDR
ncbi:FitA-like ribbon-helix-helix domain-containing protein [Azospirillum sp. sgz301742]